MPLPETEENHERTFECLIDIRLDDEDFIFKALLGIFPGLQWHRSDSSWDKIRVWGTSPAVSMGVSRPESPGPFRLWIRLRTPEPDDESATVKEMREKVLVALNATAL